MSALSATPFEGTGEEWDRYAAAAAGSTHCHRHAWLEVIRQAFAHECLPLCARGTDGELAGILPLVRVRTPIFGHFMVSMPYLSYGGPLGPEDVTRALADAAVGLAERDGVRLLELRAAGALPLELPAARHKVTVVLDLPTASEKLWNGLPSKLRSQVRRPEKEGIEVRFGPDQVEPFHRVFARHMRDLGTPPLPLRFFRAVAERFGDDAWFACAWLGGRPVAAGAGVDWQGETEIIWASALREMSRSAPNMLIYWRAMERAASRGMARFNFGRCTPGSGTHRFKLQWGGREVPLFWYRWGRGAAATPSPHDAGYGLAIQVWKRLPVPLTTRLGGWLIRGIP